ncbi:MAG: ATP-dependent 6-phosphofructokinase [Clostridiales bacterium]|nr:ATP-dependent 6-phosphofructokinase [Clostridiales bacterium]
MATKTIAILTSGGDAPGMNTAVWSAAKAAHSKGINILGIRHGYSGLFPKDKDIDLVTALSDNIINIDERVADMMLDKGGTELKTSRCKKMFKPEGITQAVDSLKAYGIEGLIVVGGDGSFRGAQLIGDRGIPTIGLPGTIDNDLAYTDYTIGFDTVCNTVVDTIMMIRDTMKSHNRVGIVEVMGRCCGDIALYSGLSAGADYVLVPEMIKNYDYKTNPFSINEILAHLDEMWKADKHYGIIVIAEGVYVKEKNRAKQLRKLIEKRSNYEVRETILGYMQRGGAPTMFDRRLAMQSANTAVDLLDVGIDKLHNGGKIENINQVVGIVRNNIITMTIDEALSKEKFFDKKMYDLVNSRTTSR